MTPLDIAKFWMKVEIDVSTKMLRNSKKWFGHCWIWENIGLNGYGRYVLRQKEYRAHRIAYYLAYGEFDEHLLVCHHCDNPICVNPEHLFLGTSKENTKDMILKGRLVRERGPEKGISYRKETGKWRARHMRNYKNILIGEYSTKEDALEALKIARQSP